MPQLYPLRFEPLLRRYVWGGRRLAQRFGKSCGDQPCAESWEVCDHGDDQSVVAAGPLQGSTLHTLVKSRGAGLMGRHAERSQFPLLFKLLDAQDVLSVQVHPDDERAAKLQPRSFGKNEAWVVLDAEPDSVIYAGLKRGVDRAMFERELARGTCALCLHQIRPCVGDCLFVPAGAVHALGRGVLVAELQQTSDVTYRLFDWNRRGADGMPRPLHIAAGLDCIDWNLGPLTPVGADAALVNRPQHLVASRQFNWDRWRIDMPATFGGDDRAHILAVISGQAGVAGDPLGAPLGPGGTILLPAECGPTVVRPEGETIILDAYLP